MTHLISGDDWAIAGAATAATAAPVADTFRKSRRFIQPLLIAGVSRNPIEQLQRQSHSQRRRRSGWEGLTRMSARGKATSLATAPIKRKLHAALTPIRRKRLTRPQ